MRMILYINDSVASKDDVELLRNIIEDSTDFVSHIELDEEVVQDE